MAWNRGQQLQGDRYIIEQVLGESGFALTYLAQDNMGGRVVMRTLNDAVPAVVAKFQEDFADLALRLRKCRHPNLVQIYDVFQEGELWCMVREYIEGETLACRAENQGVMLEGEALRYIRQVGSALAVVHKNGLLHLDVQPSNILLRAGKSEPVLIDFGIARKLTPDLTPTGSNYFAPIEQYEEFAKQGTFTDVYAMAATLYMLLTGTYPPPAPDRQLQSLNLGADPLIPPQQLNQRISDRVNEAIVQGMALEPKNRPRTVAGWLKLFSPGADNSRSRYTGDDNTRTASELERLLDEKEEDPEDFLDVHPTTKKRKRYIQDSIRLYLQEISRIRLLRVEEEVEVARKIVDLMALERVREQLFKQLKRQPQESEWAKAVKMPLPEFRQRLHTGRRAKDKMVQSNLRLVVSIAKNYTNRGLSFQDLIQEGSLGLIRAAEKFDPEKGYKFSTYATWWIRQAVRQALADQSRTIRLPVHLHETLSRIRKTIKLLYQELGRKPTEEEIAIPMEMTVEKLRFITKAALVPLSLETPIDKQEYWRTGKLIQIIESEVEMPEDFAYIEEQFRLADFLEAKGDTPEEHLLRKNMQEDIASLLDTINPREGEVLRLRYGLDDSAGKTLEEIGKIFNITRERIRQIEAKALRKLRHPSRSILLKDYFI